MIEKESFNSKYIEFKRKVLLDSDIELLKEINSLVEKFSTTSDKEELLAIEARLATLNNQFATLVGRLMGYVNFEKDSYEKRLHTEVQKRLATRERGQVLITNKEVEGELANEKQDVILLEAVYTEYYQKLSSLKNVFLAITHRLKRADSE